jgi:Skp family chaperone for outer membrane proteins
MKTIILFLGLLIGTTSLWAQEKDTTKIKIGDTKIIIIDKNKDPKENGEKIEQAKKDFEKLLDEKKAGIDQEQKKIEETQAELEKQQKELQNQQDELAKKEKELKIQELNKQVQESNKKVEDLNKEVEAINKGIADLDKEDDDYDFKIDDKEDKDWKNKKFDWDFDKKWDGDWDNFSPFGQNGKFKGHWAGFELGLNNYVNPDRHLTLDSANVGFELDGGRSWIFAINFLEFNIPFGKYAGLTTGLGTSWNNYSFRNNVNFYKDSLGVMVAKPEKTRSYNRNSIHTWNFTIPLIFEFQIPAKHGPGVFIGAGVYGTAKVASWGTTEYQYDGVKYEEKRKSDFMINSMRYGLTARIGLKYLRVFANYDLVPLFQKDRGPELYPVSVGIMLISF